MKEILYIERTNAAFNWPKSSKVESVIANVEYALTWSSHAIRGFAWMKWPLRSVVEACFDVLPSFREVQLPKRILQPPWRDHLGEDPTVRICLFGKRAAETCPTTSRDSKVMRLALRFLTAWCGARRICGQNAQCNTICTHLVGQHLSGTRHKRRGLRAQVSTCYLKRLGSD